MKLKPIQLLEKLFPIILLIMAIWPMVIVTFIVISRISYPYALERMEGVSLLQVIRILNGQALFVQPSIEYVPLIYPPVYFYLSAFIARILGAGFPALRLVSILSFVVCLFFVFKIIRSVSQDVLVSVAGVGFSAATYPLSGAWFDIARIDTLFVMFCIMGIYYSRGDKTSDMVIAGILWSLAVFTKQTAIIILILSFALFLFLDVRKGLLRIAITGFVGLLFYAVGTIVWGKWFGYFFFYLPTFHKTLTGINEISVAVLQLLFPLAIAILVSFIPFVLDKNLRTKPSPYFYYGVMTLIMFGLSLMGRLNLGGYTNVYIPAHVMVAVMFGIGIHWWKEKSQSGQQLSSSVSVIALYGLCALQFLSVYFDPRMVIPEPSLRQAWSNYETFIRHAGGDVLSPEFNYVNYFAGKASFVNQVATDEILGKYGNPEPKQSDLITNELSQDLQNKRFRLVLLKDREGAWSLVDEYYRCIPFANSEYTSGMPTVLIQEYQICSP
jgi:hypothetical protein